MKKLLSLVLAVGMLASVCAPAAYAMPDTESAAVEEMATSETAVSDTVPPAENQLEAEENQGEPAMLSAAADDVSPAVSNASDLNLNFRIAMGEDAVFTTPGDSFDQMAMVVGKKYTFYPMVDGYDLSQTAYKLVAVNFYGSNNGNPYITVESFDQENGTFVLVPQMVSSTNTFLGTLNIELLKPDGTTCLKSIIYTGSTVSDNGNLLFTSLENGLPIAALKAGSDNEHFTISLNPYKLDENAEEIEYGTTLPDSISVMASETFGIATITVNHAFGPDAFVYATVKNKATGEVVKNAAISLSWNEPIQADTLPGGEKIYFGQKQNNIYSSWYSTVYNRVTGGDTPFTSTQTLNIFFGKSEDSSHNVNYTDQPQNDTVQSISVESLNPDVLTISDVTPADGENPFSFKYAIRQDAYTTAQIKATVTLADGQTKEAYFTIDVVENAQAQEKTVSNGDELAAALNDATLVPGSTIYLKPGEYEGDFVVSTPVSLIASQYNGSKDLYDENGQPVADSNATIIEGTITAQAKEVEVYGLRFQCPEGQEGLTALCDAEVVTGCTFTGYDTAVMLAKEVHSYTNYRVVKNAFVDNQVALCFVGREWLSNVQNNSFLNNAVALAMGESSYVDGLQSTAYKAKVNGGKWTNNYFRGSVGQLVLQDNRSDAQKAAAVLLLNYNYYAYGETAGAADSLFSKGANADHSVYYTTPEMTAVSTSKSLAEVAQDGGLNLMAQQSDTSVADTALNVSGELFDELKKDTTTGELTLKVWKDNENLAAAWDFSADSMKDQAAGNVNLGVNESLSTAESGIVEEQLPEGVVAQTISFAHEGELPGTATVTVPKNEELTSADDLGLYYIDEKTGKLELQDTSVTLTEDGSLQFSIDHCSSYLVASKSAMNPPPEAPDASAVAVDYAAETLTFDGNTYEVNTASDFSSQALVSGASLSDLTGTDIYVRVKAQGDTPAGAATKVTLPSRPAAPSGLQTEKTSYADTEDGILRGVTTGMEYKAADAGVWNPCNGAEVTGLAAGTYLVRQRATDTAFAGETTEVTVAAGPERVYALAIVAPTFADLIYGQTPDAPQSLVISNTGNCDVTLVDVTVDNKAFVLNGSGETVPNEGKLESYILQPAAGLNAGAYTGTVTVTYQAGSENQTVKAEVTLTVNKAEATEAMRTVSANVTVGTDAAVTLPDLPEGAAYGTPAGDQYLSELRVADGKLSFTVSDELEPGDTCTATVPVTGGTNYNDYTVTVTLTGVAKPVPQVSVGTLNRVYNGKAVTINDIPGKTAAYDGKTVAGTWSFAEGTDTIKNAGTYAVTLVFTPDASNFDSNTVSASITITPCPAEITLKSVSNQVKVGDSMPDLTKAELDITGLVEGEKLTVDSIGVDGLPENTDKAGRWDIGLDEATCTAIQNSDVGKNYQFTFRTIPFLVLDKDSVVTDDISGDGYQVVKDEVRGETESAFDTAEKVQTELLRVLNTKLDGATTDNTLVQDITLYVSTDGNIWTEATEEDFPEKGITVTLPYPEGLENPASYVFTVVHMRKDGSVETLPAAKVENGIQFTMTSFSPVAISWAPVKKEPAKSEQAASTTTTVTSTPAPSDNTTYYTCPSCGHHDWTATEDGYRCDNCGYLESTKQLSGYGNVQGSYMPKSGSSQAAGKTAVSAIPQTGDESHMLVWVVLLFVAALGLGSLAWYKQKRK